MPVATWPLQSPHHALNCVRHLPGRATTIFPSHYILPACLSVPPMPASQDETPDDRWSPESDFWEYLRRNREEGKGGGHRGEGPCGLMALPRHASIFKRPAYQPPKTLRYRVHSTSSRPPT